MLRKMTQTGQDHSDVQVGVEALSVKVMARVWAESKQSGSALLLLLAIGDFANDEGWAFPSVATLARKCRMTERNVNLVLAKLAASGELEVHRNAGPRGCNRYRLVPHCIPAEACTLNGASQGGEAGFPEPLKPASPKPSGNHQEPPVEACKHATRFDANALELPGWLPQDLWADWVADRQERRRPISSRAAQQQLKQLAQLRADGYDPSAVIANSIANGYQGLFPPRQTLRTGSGSAPPRKPVLHADEPFTGTYT